MTGPASQPPARFTGHNVALDQYPPTSMENWEYYPHDKKQAMPACGPFTSRWPFWDVPITRHESL